MPKKKYSKMSVEELRDHLEKAQKQKLLDYAQKKKFYLKSMLDHNFNQ